MPAIGILLTQSHIQERLQWAQTHFTWTVKDWTSVLFIDESRFYVDFTDRRAWVWRSPNEPQLQHALQNMTVLARVQSCCGGNKRSGEDGHAHH
jgi:hypothetical protein